MITLDAIDRRILERLQQDGRLSNAELRRACGGPPAAVATSDELQRRIDTLREWAAQRRR